MSGKPSGYGPFRDALLGKPDAVYGPFCTICGRSARDLHHVVQKGAGGASGAVDAEIPRIRLCGHGNLDGCHGLVHAGLLHVYWKDGWAFYYSDQPMDDLECWLEHGDEYMPVFGAGFGGRESEEW